MTGFWSEPALDERVAAMQREAAEHPLDAAVAMRLAEAFERAGQTEVGYRQRLRARDIARHVGEPEIVDRARAGLADRPAWTQWRASAERAGAVETAGPGGALRPLWEASIGRVVGPVGHVCVDHEKVIATSADGITAFDVDTGERRWQWRQESVCAMTAALAPDGRLAVGTWSAARGVPLGVRWLSTEDGAPLGPPSHPKGGAVVEASPIALGHDLIVVLASGEVLALDLDLRLRWIGFGGEARNVLIQGDRVVAVGERGYRRVFDAVDGRVLPHDEVRAPSSDQLLARARAGTVTLTQQQAAAGTRARALQCVNARNGKRLGTADPPGPSVHLLAGSSDRAVAISGGRIAVHALPGLERTAELALPDPKARALHVAVLHGRVFVVDTAGVLRVWCGAAL